MNIRSIEPTPSPNTMKVILDKELPMGKAHNYKVGKMDGAPEIIRAIIQIPGVKGVYHVADFLAIERNAKFDWQEMLQEVRAAFGEDVDVNAGSETMNDHFGEVTVHVQVYKGIPMQVKIIDGNEEMRFGLPENFRAAVAKAQDPSDNIVIARKWKDMGVRYGQLKEIGDDVIEELIAAYPQDRLNSFIQIAKNPNLVENHPKKSIEIDIEEFTTNDWQIRYQLLEQLSEVTVKDLPILTKAIEDEKASIRRLATVYLGMIEDKSVLPLLYRALKDKSVTVRRTAGDCLSDLGFDEAIGEMIHALKDSSKLVRWRAAMFLYEVGDEHALPALKATENDPEFEVSLQVKMAIARIELGEEAKGSVWKQMTQSRKKE